MTVVDENLVLNGSFYLMRSRLSGSSENWINILGKAVKSIELIQVLCHLILIGDD